MQFLNTNGDEYQVNLSEYTKAPIGKSSLHMRAYATLHELYPFDSIAHEIPAECGDSLLFLDLFVPSKMLGVECHGEQHFEFNSFFHKNKLEFLKAQKRDRQKKEWAEINGVELLVVSKDDIERVIHEYAEVRPLSG